METIQTKQEIRKLSRFLSSRHVNSYIDEFTLHIPSEVTYINTDEPLEIDVLQNEDITIRVLKDNDRFYIEVWESIDGVTYGNGTTGIKVVYDNKELKIKFLGEQQ